MNTLYTGRPAITGLGRKHMINGLWIQYSQVNMAYFLMWHDQVLRIITDKSEAFDVANNQLLR